MKSLRVWVKITDYESAMEAIKQSYIIGFVLAGLHAFFLLTTIANWDSLDEAAKQYPVSYIVFLVALTIVPFLMGIRIKNNKTGFAPVLIVWGWLESAFLFFGYIGMNVEYQGAGTIFFPILIFVLGIFVLRGFNAFEAYNQIREGIVKKD